MRYLVERTLLWLTGCFLRVLPLRPGLALGRSLGRLGYRMVPVRREKALENIRKAFGRDLSEEQVNNIALSSFEALGMVAVEFFRLPLLNRDNIERFTSIQGEEILTRELGSGRGALVLSAHIGNWDMLSAGIALRGYPMSLITKVSRSRALNRIWMEYRRKKKIGLLMGRGTIKECLILLKKGELVGFALDQNARRTEGVFVPFFGREACTLTSLALLARRTGAPVIPIYSYRDGERHQIVIEEPLPHESTDNPEEDILERTRCYTQWIEKAVRSHPEQWTWLHDRWKTRPGNEPA